MTLTFVQWNQMELLEVTLARSEQLNDTWILLVVIEENYLLAPFVTL